jgi:translation initiation factor 1 (eIF-1/SUI1)
MAEVISIQKSVQHNNGDSWELDNYPPFAQTDNAEEWLGVSEISLEKAKELAFQLAGDEAYDYEDEINDAEDLYELQDVLDNFKYYQRDNTYNSSWWGGVVDFGVLTEDGEGYGTGLVLLRMHRGGDPRGNYYDMRAFELDSFIEEFPPYFGRLTYYIKTDEGDLTLDSEDMEGYSLLVVEDETGTFEQDDYVKIDEVEDAFDMNGNSFFSFGGGVAVGSLIGAYIGYKVGRARGKRKGGTFDTEKKIYGKVKKKFAGGGGVGEELMGGQPNSSKPSGYIVTDKRDKNYNQLGNPISEISVDKSGKEYITLDFGNGKGISTYSLYDLQKQYAGGGYTYQGGGGVEWMKSDGQYEAELGDLYLIISPATERGLYQVRVKKGYRGETIGVSTSEINGLDKAKDLAYDIAGDYYKQFAGGGGVGDTQIYVYSDMDSETGLIAEIENKKFDNLLDAKNYAKMKGYKVEIVELHYGNAYKNGGGVDDLKINSNNKYDISILFDNTNDKYDIEKEKIIYLLNKYSVVIDKTKYYNRIMEIMHDMLYIKLDYSKNYKQLLKELSKIENKYESVIDVVVFTKKYDGGRSIQEKDYFANGGGIDDLIKG